jgi:hypothetical protein
MWSTLLLVNRNVEMTIPEISKFVLGCSFHNLGVRVTKGFGIPSGLTNPEFLK